MTAIIAERTLADCEAAISVGLHQYIEAGRALAEIRERRLFEPDYRNFTDYLERRWEYTRARAYQLINAAAEADGLSTSGLQAPPTERRARARIAARKPAPLPNPPPVEIVDGEVTNPATPTLPREGASSNGAPSFPSDLPTPPPSPEITSLEVAADSCQVASEGATAFLDEGGSPEIAAYDESIDAVTQEDAAGPIHQPDSDVSQGAGDRPRPHLSDEDRQLAHAFANSGIPIDHSARASAQAVMGRLLRALEIAEASICPVDCWRGRRA